VIVKGYECGSSLGSELHSEEYIRTWHKTLARLFWGFVWQHSGHVGNFSKTIQKGVPGMRLDLKAKSLRPSHYLIFTCTWVCNWILGWLKTFYKNAIEGLTKICNRLVLKLVLMFKVLNIYCISLPLIYSVRKIFDSDIWRKGNYFVNHLNIYIFMINLQNEHFRNIFYWALHCRTTWFWFSCANSLILVGSRKFRLRLCTGLLMDLGLWKPLIFRFLQPHFLRSRIFSNQNRFSLNKRIQIHFF
jgi:hypothetical protein